MSDSISTEDKIRAAARAEFLAKGYNGARMEEIAQRAGINKALLHYYFRSKEKLFEEVFAYFFAQMLPAIHELVERPIPILDKIEGFIHHYINFVRKNPDLPMFILTEIRGSSQERIQRLFERKQEEFQHVRSFIGQIITATTTGEIRPFQPFHVVVNVVSMCIFPFLARPMLHHVLQLSDEVFDQLIEQRKQEVTAFVRAALTPTS